jgi:hypothetical protein
VRVLPEIEEFFRQWGGGIQESPMHGRVWKSSKTGEPIRLWSFETRLPSIDGADYNIIHTGTPLVNEMGQVNLSFLRLVGASNPDGQRFIIEQVISNKELTRMGERISRASEAFYLDFIRPVKLNVFVGMMDMTRAMENPMEKVRGA